MAEIISTDFDLEEVPNIAYTTRRPWKYSPLIKLLIEHGKLKLKVKSAGSERFETAGYKSEGYRINNALRQWITRNLPAKKLHARLKDDTLWLWLEDKEGKIQG